MKAFLTFLLLRGSLLTVVLLAFTVSAAPAMKPAPLAPVLTRIEPRGVERGIATKLKLVGTNLTEITSIKLSLEKAHAELLSDPAPTATNVWIQLTVPAEQARSPLEISAVNAKGESARVKVFVDDLPQMTEVKSPLTASASVWGVIDKAGQTDEISFLVPAGKTMVAAVSAKGIGSKLANPLLALVDAAGLPVKADEGVDESGDPYLAFQTTKGGTYRLRVGDGMLTASKEHLYRVSVGTLPYVTAVFPLSVPANRETTVELSGYNLPARSVQVKAGAEGDAKLPETVQALRGRRNFRLPASAWPELREQEPNDQPANAQLIPVPCSVAGHFQPLKGQGSDVDLFRFHAKAGQRVTLETAAAQLGSPADTKLEVLYPDGRPVERMLLQAVRDTSVTFRGVEANANDIRLVNWEEMDLDQYLYVQGDVCRIIRMPRGPDSGTLFYASNNRREAFFDTTPTAHALDTPAYIVEPHPSGAKLVANGLPVFPVYFENDDASDRGIGTDSRLHFTAPKEGDYLVRVSDSRGFSGELYAYRLIVREAQPDFDVTIVGKNPTIGAGNGRSFAVQLVRKDGFDGPVSVEISHLPPGLSASSPVVVPASQLEADGTLFAELSATNAVTNWEAVQITATATVEGRQVVKQVGNFGEIKVTERPNLLIGLEPSGTAPMDPQKPLEIFITPGQVTPAMLRVDRQNNTNLVNLDIDSLPYGIIVDSIGLNGVQIRAGENEREIFFSAAKWVPEGDRLCHAVMNSARSTGSGAGLQTSRPVWIRVRQQPAPVASAGK